MTDPFADLLADPGTRERAAKLLRLLASDAAGEAEAARAALLRLLTRHGATFDDLAHGLLDTAPSPGLMPGEESALRAALAAAERRAALAEAVSRTEAAEAEHLRIAARRARTIGIAGTSLGVSALLVAFVLLVTISPVLHDPVRAPAVAPTAREPLPAVTPAPAPPPPPAQAARPADAARPPLAGRRGRVLPAEGVLLRADPVPGSLSIDLLPQGTSVAVVDVFDMLGTQWMKVRAPQGLGFVPASTVGPE